jgi:hypothetical protein
MKFVVALVAILALANVISCNQFQVDREERVAVKSAHGTFIRCHPGGEGSRVDLQTQIGDWEKITLQYLTSGKVALRTWHNTYVRTHPGGEGSRVDIQGYLNAWETYDLIRNADGTVSFRSIHGTYLRAHPGGEGARLDTQTYLAPWEKFNLVPLDPVPEVTENRCG